MARNSKYSTELQKIICDAIATKGSDRDGYEAGGIHHKTFYNWIAKHDAFRAAVQQARKEAIKNRPPSLTRSAFEVAQKLFVEGTVINRTKTSQRGKLTRNIYKFDKDGKKKLVRIEEEIYAPDTDVWIDRNGVPQWLVQRYLPQPEPDVEGAIAIIKKAGLDVFIANAELYAQFVETNAPVKVNNNEVSPEKFVGASQEKEKDKLD